MAAPIFKMLTANCLKSGDVLYWKENDWVLDLAAGDVFSSEMAAKAALETAQVFIAANRVVAPYLFDVRVDGGLVIPVKEREIVRSRGPSVRADLGKQTHV